MANAVAEVSAYGNWLEHRHLEARWGRGLSALASVVALTLVGLTTWWLLYDPRGWLRWYTPQYGYMYIRWILIIAIWQVYLFHYWPFTLRQVAEWHPVVKGLTFTVLNVALMGVLIWGFYYNVFGRLAMPYFSWPALRELGITDFFAREYSALAILMVASVASWLSPAWPVTFDNWPWSRLRQPFLGFSVWIWTFLLTTYVFFFVMHPHYGILFYPWQKFTAAFPWYYDFARTLHGNFSVGLMMWCTVTIWLTETIWERKPWTIVKKQPWQGLFGFFGVILLAVIFYQLFNFWQDIWWGPAVEGGKRITAPDWRYLHSGEMAVFILTAALVLTFYLGNWPTKYAPEINWVIRTVIVVVAGLAYAALYYKFSPPFLGTQVGVSHPQQFPLTWTIWLIDLMLIHYWFMDGWPFYKATVRKEVQPAA